VLWCIYPLCRSLHMLTVVNGVQAFYRPTVGLCAHWLYLCVVASDRLSKRVSDPGEIVSGTGFQTPPASRSGSGHRISDPPRVRSWLGSPDTRPLWVQILALLHTSCTSTYTNMDGIITYTAIALVQAYVWCSSVLSPCSDLVVCTRC